MKKLFIVRLSIILSLLTFSFLLVSCNNNAAPIDSETSSDTTPVTVAPHTHEWDEWATVNEPTCLTEGKAERICACGEKETKTLQAVGHTGKDWIIDKEATLKEQGERHQVCSVCNESFNKEVIPTVTVTPLPGITDLDQYEFRPYYNLGHCRTLKGSPVVVLLFVDDNDSSWTKEEVLTATEDHIMPGLEYLEENAKKWGVDLDFVTESYSTPLSGYEIKYEGSVNPNLFDGGSTKDVVDKAAADIGCGSNWELYSYFKSKYPNDDIIFLSFFNKWGISYTRNIISAGYTEYAEHSVIFAENSELSETRLDDALALTVSRSILRLFGAESYFNTNDREALAIQKYPNDIMLSINNNIEENSIGHCTAYTVGWCHTVPQVCYDLRWWE